MRADSCGAGTVFCLCNRDLPCTLRAIGAVLFDKTASGTEFVSDLVFLLGFSRYGLCAGCRLGSGRFFVIPDDASEFDRSLDDAKGGKRRNILLSSKRKESDPQT